MPHSHRSDDIGSPDARGNSLAADSHTSAEAKVQRQRRQELEHHIRSCPTDQEAYRELAAIYRKEERPQESVRVLNEAVRMFPSVPTLLWELEEAKLARSLQQFREVSRLAEKLRTPEMDRELKRSRDDWAYRRIDVCKARLTRDPSLVHLRLVLAEAFFDGEQYEQAIEQAEALIPYDEFSPQAYLIRGRSQLLLGFDAEAMASLRAVSMRRSVVAPVSIKIAALKLLCDTAERLGIDLTLQQYRSLLAAAESEAAKQSQAKTKSEP